MFFALRSDGYGSAVLYKSSGYLNGFHRNCFDLHSDQIFQTQVIGSFFNLGIEVG